MKTLRFELPVMVSVSVTLSQGGLSAEELNKQGKEALSHLTTDALLAMLQSGDATLSLPANPSDSLKAEKTLVEKTADIYKRTVDSVKQSLNDGYKVLLYSGPQSKGEVLQEVFVQTMGEAESYVSALTSEEIVNYASVRVLSCLTNTTLLSASSPRGGWEVAGYSANDELVFRESWLEKEAVKASLRRSLAREGLALVTVTDFSDVTVGPVIVRRVSL